MLTAQQMEARRNSIGSTDIAAIVALYRPELAHLSKRKNATDVWLRLLYDIEQPVRSVMGRGHRVEPLLRELYRETVGPVEDAPGTIRHPTFSWAVGSPDGLNPEAVAEYKSASVWVQNRWGEPGTDRVPDDYNLQVQWLLEVADRPMAHVLVAFGKDITDDDGRPDFAVSDTAFYLVPRDRELASSMLDCGAKFLEEHVMTRVPPMGLAPLHNRRQFKQLEKEAQWKQSRK